MMRNVLMCCLLLVILVLAGCSGTKVLKTETGEGVNLASYKTFDFFQVEASGDTVAQGFQDRITRIEDGIALELQKHGYLLSKTNPDLLVNIGLVVNQQMQTRETNYLTDAPRYIGQRRYSWKSEDVVVSKYREGTVTVDLVDRVQNKMVWQGTVQGVVPEKEEKLDVAIKKGVKKLFANLRS